MKLTTITRMARVSWRAALAASAITLVHCDESTGPSRQPLLTVTAPASARDVTPTTVQCDLTHARQTTLLCSLRALGSSVPIYSDSSVTAHGSTLRSHTALLPAGTYVVQAARHRTGFAQITETLADTFLVAANHHPALALLAPPDSLQILQGDSVAFAYSASDADNDPITVRGQEVGGNLFHTGGPAGAGYVRGLTIGSHRLRFMASDGFSADSADRVVLVAASLPGPRVFFNGMSGRDVQALTESCTATNAASPRNVHLTITNNGTIVDSASANSDLVTARQYASGTYGVTCIVNAANGSDIATGSFSVSANQAPIITGNPAGTLQAIAGDSITYLASAVDPEADAIDSLVTRINGSEVARGTTTTSTTISLPAGTYTLDNAATDRYGATGVLQQTLRFLTPPVPTISVTPDTAWTQDNALGQTQSVMCGAQNPDGVAITAYALTSPAGTQTSNQPIFATTREPVGAPAFACTITDAYGHSATAADMATVLPAFAPSATLDYQAPYFALVGQRTRVSFTRANGTWGNGTANLQLDGNPIVTTVGAIDTSVTATRGNHVLSLDVCDGYAQCTQQNIPFRSVVPVQAQAGSLSAASGPTGTPFSVMWTPTDIDTAYSLVRNLSGFVACGDGTEVAVALHGPGVPVSGSCTPSAPGTYTVRFGVRQYGPDRFFSDGSVNPAAALVESAITRTYTAQ